MNLFSLIGGLFNISDTTLSTVKNILAVVLAIGALGAGGTIVYKLVTNAAKVQKLNDEVQTVSDTAKKLADVVTDTKKSVDVNTEAEKQQIVINQDTNSKHEKRKDVVAKKIKQIQDDKKIDPVAKQQDLSEVYIKSVWQEYCAASNNIDTACLTLSTSIDTNKPNEKIKNTRINKNTVEEKQEVTDSNILILSYFDVDSYISRNDNEISKKDIASNVTIELVG